MLNPFFKNVGPFKIQNLLISSGIKNKDNFKNDKIYDVKDLSSVLYLVIMVAVFLVAL